MTYYGLDLYGRPRLAELLRETRTGRGDRLDPHPLLLSPVLHRRALRRPGPRSKDHPVSRHAASAHQRPDAQADEPAAQPARDRGDHRPPAGDDPGSGACARRSSWAFPGETEAEFAELLEFVAATRFERLGAFTYSFEPDTPAAKLPDHLPEEVKEERKARLMAVQQPIAFAFNQSLVGRTLDVLIDAPAPEGKTPVARPDLRRRSRRRRQHLGPRRALQARRPGRVRDRRRRGARPDRPAGVDDRRRKRRKARPRPRRKPQSSLAILDGM